MDSTTQTDRTPEVTTADLAQLLGGRDADAAGVNVVDVREPGEYVAGHVPGARLVPMGQLPSRVDELRADGPVYVVCASGGRSAAMTDFLVTDRLRRLLGCRRHVGLAAVRPAGRRGHTAVLTASVPLSGARDRLRWWSGRGRAGHGRRAARRGAT